MRRTWLIVLFAALLLTGCSPQAVHEQPVQQGFIPLDAQHTLGQTFTARFAGLKQVVLYLQPGSSALGELVLHLRANPAASTDLAQARLPLQTVTAPGYYAFTFPSQQGSNQQDYYFLIEVQGEGSAGLGSGPPYAYLDGAMYYDGQPLEGQLAFDLGYSPPRLAAGLLLELLGWCGGLLALVFLLVLPGWSILALLLPGWPARPFAVKASLAAGVGLALYPLLFLWSYTLGQQVLPGIALLPGLLGAAWLAWSSRSAAVRWFRGLRAGSSQRRIPPVSAWLPPVLLVVSLGVIFLARMWLARSLAAPLWGDSYQHTMIAQLMLDNQGLFTSWQPYIPYSTLSIQYGFSSLAAVFAWLTRQEMIQAVLTSGQLLNLLAVAALYPLALRLSGGSPWAGIGAVVCAGLLCSEPARYVNWGRYAQLAGQAILPAALWLALEVIDPTPTPATLTAAPPRAAPFARVVLAGAVLAGMTLTYYRMPFFYAAFLLAWLACVCLPAWRLDLRRWARALGWLILAGVCSLLLFSPWLGHMLGGELAASFQKGLAAAPPVERARVELQDMLHALSYASTAAWLLGAAGLAWSLWKKRGEAAAVALWLPLLFALILGQFINLPGSTALQSFALLIALYLPLSLLAGLFFGQLETALEGKVRWAAQGTALLLLGLSLWGTPGQFSLVYPQSYTLVTRADLRAMQWLRQNTDEEALFLVEGFRVYGGASAVGSDGGWWLSLLALRHNSMPPQYALISEVPFSPDYSQEVVDLVAQLETTSAASFEGFSLLCQHGISHVYIGQTRGATGNSGPPLFLPQDFAASPFYEPVYRQDRVAVFALKYDSCPTRP